uniref:WRC domain-containing protein n=2 Tax=Picea sitchensis TaxID=3332 RepID=D5AE11_PICSI|nr:unknown [Picea sitchensis]
MRIRNRSGALFTSTSCIAINTGHKNGEEEEFLLPLVAAVLDVQRAEEEEEREGEGDHGTLTTAPGIHMRPAHNWRSALQLQRRGEGNTESQALKDEGEGKKADREWKGSMRNQWDNIDLGLFTQNGTREALLKNTSSSAEKEIMGGHGGEWKLPKSGGRFEMGTLWRQQKNLSVHGVKRKRSKNVIGHINEWKHETNTTKKIREKTDIQQEDGRKVGEKAMPDKRYDNSNEVEGSQCRRRNGRGWRCSQRTLVGYSLCEYHLGKGRLRSINKKNKNAGRVLVNNKAGTCKLKELRLIDSS